MSNARNLANFLGTSATVPSGKVVTASLPTGSVLQVVQGSLKSAFTGTGASGSSYLLDIALSATITPTATNSSILIDVSIYVGADQSNSSGYHQTYYVYKAGSELTSINGTSTNSRPAVAGMINMYDTANTDTAYRVAWLGGKHLETNVGTTSATEYKIYVRGYSGGPVMFVNRSQQFQASAGNYDGCPNSTITLTEIAV